MHFAKTHHHLHRFAPELFRYGLASAFALCVDVTILWLLVNYAGWFYLPASMLAFVAGTAIVYFLSVRFVFGFHHVKNRAIELGYFFTLGIAGLFVNSATLAVAVSAAGLGLIAAKLIAASCTFLTNFVLRRQILFVPPSVLNLKSSYRIS